MKPQVADPAPVDILDPASDSRSEADLTVSLDSAVETEKRIVSGQQSTKDFFNRSTIARISPYPNGTSAT